MLESNVEFSIRKYIWLAIKGKCKEIMFSFEEPYLPSILWLTMKDKHDGNYLF
jgi:hypothetical protein